MPGKKRKDREQYSALKYGYYHLSTDGWKDGFLFHTNAQYAFGMTVIGLLTLLFDVKIYAFSLMPNHIHIILSGTGRECLKAFDYLRLKLSGCLVKDGYAPLPDDYWFKLVAIETPIQMRNNFLYVDRNAYEHHVCIPSGYPWGSCYLYYSFIHQMITAPRADSLSKRKLERITGTRISIPGHWRFHPEYGLLPSSFVDKSLFTKLFDDPKDYESRLVKDYEAFVKVAGTLDETLEYSKEDIIEIVRQVLNISYSGRRLSQLSNDEKGRMTVTLMKQYKMPEPQIAKAMDMSERMVRQFLNAKDYGKR